MKNRFRLLIVSSVLVFSSFVLMQKEKPVLYIIGDSTVKNGDGTGKSSLWGWGSVIANYFDTNHISVQNHAIGGRSSRTFLTEGRWDRVMDHLKKGDFVLMQFGHNDGGPLDDTARARGSIRGIGEETRDIYNPIQKKQETVHSYGWYMRKYIRDTKSRGAIPIVCSPIPRNEWKDGKVVRSADSYAGWARQVAEEEGAYFIDLNDVIATKYEGLGADKVKTFFPGDHTHTNQEGAVLNAQTVVEELKKLKGGPFKKFLLQ